MPNLYSKSKGLSQSTFTPISAGYRAQIDELVEQSKLAEEELFKFMGRLCSEVENKDGKSSKYLRAPLKKRVRIAEKCGITNWNRSETDKIGLKEPVDVKDIARATIVLTDMAQMLAVRDYIKNTEEFKKAAKKAATSPGESRALKDLWKNGEAHEYKDIKFFLQVNIKYAPKGKPKQIIPHIVELQLNVAQMARGKGYGHAFYNLTRLALIEGEQRFEANNSKCIITIPKDKTGSNLTKLRTAIVKCRSLAGGKKEEERQEVMEAANILSKMISKYTQKSGMQTTENDSKVAVLPKSSQAHNEYKNLTRDIVINCYPYKPGSGFGTAGAEGWAIERLSRFVWSNYTRFQANTRSMGLAKNIHAA